MQDTLAIVAGLAYAASALEFWRTLAVPAAVKMDRLVVIPGVLFVAALAGAVLTPVIRRALMRHLWISYRTGFGQSPISVLGGAGVLLALAILSVWPLLHPDPGGVRLGGGLSAYGAGVGLLLAQSLLVRRLEADPFVRQKIDDPTPPTG
jgi:hypothetical protein